jgi:hypothetical protein
MPNPLFVLLIMSLAAGGAAVQGALPEFQPNQPESTLLMSAQSPLSSCEHMAAFLNTLIGAPWDLGVAGGSFVVRSAGAVESIDRQVLNLDMTAPSFALR